MKTIQELENRIKLCQTDYGEGLMVQMSGGYHPLMDWVPAFYKEDAKDKVTPLTKESVIAAMKEYMSFALEKARGERGLSAGRSMWKYKQWLWALEDDEFDTDNYTDYGLAILEAINKKYNLGPSLWSPCH